MQYRAFGKTGANISALGFGCMRFPTRGGRMDEREAQRMLRYAIDHGVNYIDTAYFYHDGQSEGVVGRALTQGYREKVFLATKAPVFSFHGEEDFDRVLSEQLERLGTDYIDFYLLHSMTRNTWRQAALKWNLPQKMERARAAGKIRWIGFSFHDEFSAFEEILNGYDGWDFCQLQINYVDVERQAGLRGLEEAAKRGLGVVAMEPLRGGKLAEPSAQVRAQLSLAKTPVEWALDFVWNRPEVSFLLSGMSTMAQVEQNLAYANRSACGMLSQQELAMLCNAKKVFDTMALVPCTQCGYCMPCPFEVNIPAVYKAYNATACEEMETAVKQYEVLHRGANACRACRACEKICPQQIESSAMMPKIAKLFAMRSVATD